MKEVQMTPMQPADWERVAKIYEEGIGTGIATFETQVPDYALWDTVHLKCCRIVASLNAKVVG